MGDLLMSSYLLNVDSDVRERIAYTSGNIVWNLMDTYEEVWSVTHLSEVSTTYDAPYLRLTVF